MALVTNLSVHDFGDCKNSGWDPPPPGFRKSCDGNSPYAGGVCGGGDDGDFGGQSYAEDGGDDGGCGDDGGSGAMCGR